MSARATLPAVVALAVAIATMAPSFAHADPKGVGLGVAIGGSFSPTKLQQGTVERTVGGSFSWGFFVDIPLLETFYISPAAMLYELDTGDGTGRNPATDIDLNFKFVVPIGDLSLGVGVLGGLTNAELTYQAHFGALAYVGYNIVGNLDLFVLAQWKRLVRQGPEIDYIHAYGGGMFRF